ncbi:nuclear transport factor 2 family protein [Nonomuraea jiangxiensis]|uniref:SnoaL-like domain-containing protein n=1 Tax=Nonomuraea jiangxiensis TaxID=633440 RepID=A0A1G9UFJ3_9ACTN|nr:nuclear transport factor 2 family protein [Nonomuraea jiangxiensis]SDM58686.1 SnoaL-like domain-containing protein [Nonomuraea jiangxiensis]
MTAKDMTRRSTVAGVLGALALGATPVTATAAAATPRVRDISVEDRQALVDTMNRYGRFTDDQDWAGLASILADTIDLDFTSLFGGNPEKVTRAELVARWRGQSEGLDSTQHLIAGILPTVNRDTATVVANLVAVHRRVTATGGPLWTVGGTYRFGLRRTGGGWVIDSMTLHAAWVDGNQAVVTGGTR